MVLRIDQYFLVKYYHIIILESKELLHNSIMAIHKKKIEFFTVELKSEENYSFEKLITSSEVVEREFRIKGKDVSLRILNKGNDTIIGLVETSRNENIPPKKNKKKKTIEKLGLEVGEGLAYANIFIYEKKRQILMYEVNKFGCFIDHFIEYIFRCCKKSKSIKPFDIVQNPVKLTTLIRFKLTT